MVDKEVLDNLKNILNGKWISDGNDLVYDYNFKVVPYTSLGKENGMILGFKPDYIKVYEEETHLRNDIVIGIYDGQLSRVNLYTSLIGLNILKEERKNEFIEIA